MHSMTQKNHLNGVWTSGTHREKSREQSRGWYVTVVVCLLAVGLYSGSGIIYGQSLSQLLNHAPTTQPPSSQLAPDTRPGFNPLKPMGAEGSLQKRTGTLVLSNGKVFTGKISTTIDTPFRIWISAIKRYKDIAITRIKSIHVKILAHRLIREWRFLQDGSDIKVYSGKTQPWFRLAYTFTLLRGQKVTGSLVAPLYVESDGHIYNFLIYKHLQGKMGEPVADVLYVKSVHLKVTHAVLAVRKKMTRKLPLVQWRKMGT